MSSTVLRIVWCVSLFLSSLFSLHAEDFWQDTLWVRKIPHVVTGTKIMFHPDSKTIFVISDQNLFQYDVQSGTLLKTYQTNSGLNISDYKLSPDNQILVIVTHFDKTTHKAYLELWHRETGFIKSYEVEQGSTQYAAVRTLTITPDMKYAFVGYMFSSNWDETTSKDGEKVNKGLDKFSLENGEKVNSNVLVGGILSISPSADELVSQYIYFISLKEILIYTVLLNPDNLTIKKYLPEPIGTPKYSPDGQYIGGFTNSRAIVLYDIEKDTLYTMYGHTGVLRDVHFTSDGKYIVSVAEKEYSSPIRSGYRVWDVHSKKQVFETSFLNSQISSFDISNDGSAFATTEIKDGLFLSMFKFRSTLSSLDDNSNTTAPFIHPNPTSDNITIDWNNGTALCQLINSQGNIISEQTITGNITLDTQEFTNGLYIVRIQQGGTTISKQIIILK